MLKFRYKAIDSNNKYVHGEISAINAGELENILKESGLYLVSYTKERKNSGIFGLGASLNNKDLITLFTHLEQLDRAGVSIIESLEDIKDSNYPTKITNLVQEIHESVKNGSLFSEALSKHPKIFSSVFVGLIASGEKTGNLSDSFKSIIDHLKWSDDIRRKTVKAIRYPLFSIMIMFGVLWVMTSVVVPKVTDFLITQDIELPAITKGLIAFSKFMQNETLMIILTIIIIFITYKILRTFPNIRLRIDKYLLYMPIFGSIITKLEASRFCHFFAMTFKSGIGVLDCMDAAKEVVNNRAIRLSIEDVKRSVSDGKSIAQSIADTGYFSGLVIRMFKVGENSGNMEKALQNISFFYDQEINDSIDKIVGMIQPALTLVMGGMMAWITVAVFGPIYGSFANL